MTDRESKEYGNERDGRKNNICTEFGKINTQTRSWSVSSSPFHEFEQMSQFLKN